MSQCPICHKEYYNIGSLWCHQTKTNHTLPFRCNLCERTFADAKALARHIWSPTHERNMKSLINRIDV